MPSRRNLYKGAGPRVRLYAHGDLLIINTVDAREDKKFTSAGGTRYGCIIVDTGRNVGVSPEALSLLRRIPRGTDAEGDVDSWELAEQSKRWCFGWLGAPDNVKDVSKGLVGSRTYRPDFPHVTIPNDVPREALFAIRGRK